MEIEKLTKEEKDKIWKDFIEKFSKNQKDMPKDFQEFVNEHFWDLI